MANFTMSRKTLMERLRWLAAAKPGDDLPDWMGGPGGNWGPPLSDVARNAIEEIEALEQVGAMRWRPIAEAPFILNPSRTYEHFRCLIQSDRGYVFGGYARFVQIGKQPWKLRWYADHCDRWEPTAKYFMPLPEPRED